MNNTQKSILVSSKVIAIIMKIGYIAMIVAASICAVCLIFIAVNGGETSLITSGGMKIVAMDKSVTTTEAAIAIASAVLIMCAFLFVIFLLTYKVFNEVGVTGTPFNVKHVKSIRLIGIHVAAMTIAGGIADAVAASYAGTATLGIYTGASGLIVGAVIFCLGYVYEYGCELQAKCAQAQ